MSRVRRVVLAALLLSPPAFADEGGPSSAQARGEGRRLMEAGKAAFRAKRFDEAARLFEAAHGADPTLLIALYNRAFSYRKAGMLKEAEGAYRAFLEKAPDDLDGLFGLAETQRLLGDAKAAVQSFSTYVDKERRPDKARYVAYAQGQIQRLAEEISSAPAAPSPAPPDASALVEEAARAYGEKRYADAADLYARAHEVDPARTDALYRRALSLRKAGHLDEARAAYTRLLDAVPGDPDGTYGLAETYRLLDDKARAADLFERYAEIETRPSEARFVARARQLVVELRAALEAERLAQQAPERPPEPPAIEAPAIEPPATEPALPTEPVVALPPPDVGAGPNDSHRAKLGRALAVHELLDEAERALNRGQPEEAEARFVLALAAAPEDSENARKARLGRVQALDALGRWEDARAEEAALAALEEATAPEGQDALTSASEASESAEVAASGEAGSGEAASGEATPSARPEPPRRPSEAFLARARALREEAREALRARDAESAAKKAEAALGYVPSDLEALLLLGSARLQLDDDPAAQRAFSRALALHPGAARPLWALARLHDKQGRSDDAKRYYALYLRSDAADRDPDLVREAEYKLEIP